MPPALALLVPLAAMLAGVALAPSRAAALVLLTEENPPFNYTDKGRLAGSGADVVVEMAKRARLDATTEILPWDAAFVRAQAVRETCLFSTARLPNRERLFTWVGPIAFDVWVIYGRADFPGSVGTLADLKPWRVGGVDRDAKVEFLHDNALTNVRAIADDRMNPARLFLPAGHPDHIDLWIAGIFAARELAKAAKVADLVKLVYVVRELPLYLACSPTTSPATIKALNAALESVKADGTLGRISGEYERRFAQ